MSSLCRASCQHMSDESARRVQTKRYDESRHTKLFMPIRSSAKWQQECWPFGHCPRIQ